MNRNYLPPSLMHPQSSPSCGVVSNGNAGQNTTQSAQQSVSHPYVVYQGNHSLPHLLSSSTTSTLSQHGPNTGTVISVAGIQQSGRGITAPNNNGIQHSSNTGLMSPKTQPSPQITNQLPYYPPLPGVSAGQSVNMGPVGNHSTTPQPIRLGRTDRFSRTCKLPTVQEIGKYYIN